LKYLFELGTNSYEFATETVQTTIKCEKNGIKKNV